MKVLRCREVGFDCNHEIRAESAAEILQKAAEHAQLVHHMTVTAEIAEQVKSLIKEERE